MALQRCQTIWGNTTLIRSAPLIEQHRDVIFVPFSSDTYLDNDRSWGIFDRDGRLLEAACYHRGPDHRPLCQDNSTHWRFEDLPEAPEPHYVYGGTVVDHYGHFILTTLSRFWWYADAPHSMPLLCHASGLPEHWMTLPYREAMLGSLGLTPADFVTLERPTRIRQLTLPRIALEEQNYVHAAMASLCHRVGTALLADRERRRNDTPVYFAKTGLNVGVTRFSNEADLTARLARDGVDIIMPERLSLRDQVYEFATRATVIGSVSSAFHTSIFATPTARLICIAPNSLLNSNFLLVDKVSGNRAEYFFPEGGTVLECNTGGFMQSNRIADPVSTAEDILRIL